MIVYCFLVQFLFVLSEAISDDTLRYLPCNIKEATSINDNQYDSVVLVLYDIGTLDISQNQGSTLENAINEFLELDKISPESPHQFVIPVLKAVIPSGRLIYSHTGPINRDYDDVRTFFEAAEAGIKRALKAGSKAPLLLVQPAAKFSTAKLVAVLGALSALYTPLEVREAKGAASNSRKAELLGIYSNVGDTQRLIEMAAGVDAGRYVAKDICGSDPIRMTPIQVEEYVKILFQQLPSSVKVRIISDQSEIARAYPLLGAVNRATHTTPEFHSRVIWLEYTGAGPISETVMLVGKGVTLDTGGLDIKYGGNMYSMSRDKCGAAAVAGFFKVLDALKPPGLKAIGVMSLVRNNIGQDAFSCDEILTARSGKRIRIVNTDAEGRMAMMDPLNEIKEMALNETHPQIYTIATLTYHAMKTVGKGYTIVMDNGPAKQMRNSFMLQDAADQIGDMVEISTVRREDYKAHKGKTEYEDLLQSSSTGGSSSTPRGHQNPAAFLIMGSGLDNHGTGSQHPIKYSHLDVAATANFYDFPEIPPGSPVAALAARHILGRV